MLRQNSIKEEHNTITLIKEEDGEIKFNLSSKDSLTDNSLDDIVKYSENTLKMYYSKQINNDTVKSLITGDLNYASQVTMTPYCPPLTTNYDGLTQDDEPKLIDEAEYKDPINTFEELLKFLHS